MSMLTLKRDRPMLYWARLLLIGYWVVSLSAAGFANADTISSGTGHELMSDTDHGSSNNAAAGCRQMNGTLWYFTTWRNPEDNTERAIVGYYSTDNASTWSSPLIIIDWDDPDFNEGGYPYAVWDAVALSNNSIIVFAGMFNLDSAAKLEGHIFAHWNNSDLTQWERVPVAVHNSYHYYGGTMAVNATDKVLAVYYRGTTLFFDHFDPVDLTLDLYDKSNAYPYYDAWALVNESNAFLVTYENGGSFYLMTADAAKTVITSGSLAGLHMYDAVMNINGTLFYVRSTGGGGGMYINYWCATESGAIDVTDLGTVQYAKLGLSNLDHDYLTVTAYNSGDDKYYWWGARWWKSDAHWKTTQSELFAETDDYISNFAVWMPHHRYPISVNGSTINYTQIPATFGHYLMIIENDALNGAWDYWELHADGMAWPGIANWTFDPTWEPPAEDENGDDEVSAITCQSGYLIMVVWAVIGIGIIGVLADRML